LVLDQSSRDGHGLPVKFRFDFRVAGVAKLRDVVAHGLNSDEFYNGKCGRLFGRSLTIF